MLTEIAEKRERLDRICRERAVERLVLFGSATGNSFDREHSDLDFLVRFRDLPPAAYADAYFGLLEDLQSLFGRDIDLLTEPALRNPFLRQEIERGQTLLYAA